MAIKQLKNGNAAAVDNTVGTAEVCSLCSPTSDKCMQHGVASRTDPSRLEKQNQYPTSKKRGLNRMQQLAWNNITVSVC